jgi:hypothetical protein
MIETEKRTFRDEERAEDYVSQFLDEVAKDALHGFKLERLEHEEGGATTALWSGNDLIAVAITIHDSSENIVSICVTL